MTAPNVIWIYCDELRTDALGCYGNPYIRPQTPNIDALAASGIQFDNCFCNSPVCVASRTSILTGLYPEDTGVYHNEAYWPGYRFDNPPQTFPEVFAQNGYATANFGKVHVPKSLSPWMHSEEEGSGMRDFFAHATPEEIGIIRPPGSPLMIGGHYPASRPYPPEKVTENALTWMASTESPYLVRLSYLQPHTPVFPQPPFDTLYETDAFPTHIEENMAGSLFEQRFAEVLRIKELTPREIGMAQAHFYGLVAWLDNQIGQVLAFLRRTNQVENTIIVFEADHGTSLGEMGRYQKQTFAPESHRVPRLLSWPGTISAGQVRKEICASLDLARTLFALTGIQSPAQFKGSDLLGANRAPTVFATIGYGFPDSRIFPNLKLGDYVDGHGWPRRACVRTDRYRLDKNVRIDGRAPTFEEEDIFFVDVEADPAERINRAQDPALNTVLAELNHLLDAHIANSIEPEWELTQGKTV